ncbi:transcription factor E4F1-like isoform X2 [Zootermopsis nevadensis]|uniref:transcription factor E4F1-like isoform X2 n=1 Tax=Zootermopsis nevadensis TaxID=136037 RepID=UPI000B8E708A|nr:transcription factor E4F1-like isoform X2 [Zootermopsis nevadensis]
MAAEVRKYVQCMRTQAKIFKHDEEYSYSVDYFRCGKCSIEFCKMEEFVLHKLFVEHCGLMLCASGRIQGLQIPKFVQQATDVKSTKLRTESKGSEQDTCAESTVANTTDINYDVDLQVDDLLTFKQNNRNTETNRHTPKQKQRHSQGQQASNVFGAENDTDHNTETEKVILRTHISTVHSETRPYHCQQCPDTFKTKGSLVRHIRRHTDERPFHCQYCGRSFRESGALTRHVKSRVSCLTKTDADLPRYGKDETLQIIISRVSEEHCNTKTDEEDHCNTEDNDADENIVINRDNCDYK